MFDDRRRRSPAMAQFNLLLLFSLFFFCSEYDTGTRERYARRTIAARELRPEVVGKPADQPTRQGTAGGNVRWPLIGADIVAAERQSPSLRTRWLRNLHLMTSVQVIEPSQLDDNWKATNVVERTSNRNVCSKHKQPGDDE